MTRGRSRRIVALATLVVVSLAAPPAAGRPLGAGPAATIDPGLVGQIARGPTIAIMTWDPHVTDRSAIARSLRGAGVGGRVLERLPVAFACVDSRAELGSLAATPGVRALVADAPLLSAELPEAGWGSHAPPSTSPDVGVDGAGTALVVIDSGVDGTHPDLRFGERMHTNVRVVFSHQDLTGPRDPICAPDRFTDEFVGHLENTETVSGHGTFMAGVAAGDGAGSEGKVVGVAPGAEVVGIGATDIVWARADVLPGCAPRGHMSSEDGYSCDAQLSTLGAIAGMEFAISRLLEVENPAKVILAAWGVDGLLDPWHPLAQAISVLPAYGIAFVTAVGNEGPGESDCGAVPTCGFNPLAAVKDAIGVASGRAGPLPTLDDFSSRGDPEAYTYHDETFRYEPTITARGASVTAARATVPVTAVTGPPGGGGTVDPRQRLYADPDYVTMSGTSVAAAQVAGTILLMQQAAVEAKGCYLTVNQIHEVFEASAAAMGGYERWEVGAGLLDAERAVELARIWPRKFARESYLCPAP